MTKLDIPAEQVLTGFILFSCLAILVLVYHSTAASFYQVWIAENSLQSHGLLLLPLSCYILAREWLSKRDRLMIRFRPVYLVALMILSFVWLLSEMAQIQLVSQVLLIFILCFAVFALFGMSQTATLAFPILILLSATPVWSVLSQPLQEPTAYIVNQMLHLTGYTSFREGYYITIPEGIFEVGDTCSGLRYQIAAITLSIIYAFFAQYSLPVSFLYLLLASGVAFVSNTIRIYIVVLSGHYTNMTHSLLEDHIWLGWVVFVVCYAGFMYATVSLDRRVQEGANEEEGTSSGAKKNRDSYKKPLAISSVLLLCASIGPLYSAVRVGDIHHEGSTQVGLNLDGLGLNAVTRPNDWDPVWLEADSELRATYRFQGHDLDFYSAYYGNQAQGKEAVSDLNHAYEVDRWKREYRRNRVISFPGGGEAAILEETITGKAGQRRIVWSWYYIGGYMASSKLKGKLFGMVAGLRGRNEAAVIVLSTVYDGDGTAERGAMQDFVDQAANEIERQYRMK